MAPKDFDAGDNYLFASSAPISTWYGAAVSVHACIELPTTLLSQDKNAYTISLTWTILVYIIDEVTYNWNIEFRQCEVKERSENKLVTIMVAPDKIVACLFTFYVCSSSFILLRVYFSCFPLYLVFKIHSRLHSYIFIAFRKKKKKRNL